jgi:cell division protein FtsI/penicillin-binding protein 2
MVFNFKELLAPKLNKKFLLTVSAVSILSALAVPTYDWLKRPEVLNGIGEFVSGKPWLTKEALASAIGDSARFYRFPTEIDFEIGLNKTGNPKQAALGKQTVHAVLEYTFEPKLQQAMEDLIQSYSPDYGAFVAIDASTGKVLSMVSYSNRPEVKSNLALRATFPSASVFKMVTAAAAIAERNFSPDTVISFNGANHSLYRGNVLNTRVTRWTRSMTLKTAFAKSVNTVFGKIGAFKLEPAELREYADRFGFNRKIAADLPVEEGHAPVSDDPWSRAETASGFTRENTMSPMQGALMAAAIANDGVMMEPYVVKSVFSADGTELYAAQPKVFNQAVDPNTAAELRELMKETVARGTSHKSFRGFFKKDFADIDVGGKTGSLTGDNPAGKYDWFVGFANDGNRKIAFASLTIHEKFWKVKSSYLVRRAIETYFGKGQHKL